MESPEELLAFHAASKDSILPKSGAFKNIELSVNYFVPQAVIRELDNRKQGGHSDGGFEKYTCTLLTISEQQTCRRCKCFLGMSPGLLPCSLVS